MIQFNPLRTKRLSVNLKELTIDAAEEILMMPEQLEQAATTAMLEHVVVNDGRPLPGQVSDPRMWTVQERTMVMTHYMAHTTEDGNPDFAVGSNAKFSDYFLNGTDYIEEVDLGVIDGDQLVMRPLLGFQAEAIERLLMSRRLKPNRLSWWAAAMACQVRRATEEPMERLSDAEYAEWLLVRADAFRTLPESEFAAVLGAFLDGTDRLSHFFRIAFGDTSIVCMPNAPEGKEVSELLPARFPVHAAVSEFTLQILGVADRYAGGTGAVLRPTA